MTTRALPWTAPLLLAAAISTAFAQPPDTTPGSPGDSEWRRGVDEIVGDIRAHHPDPFVRVGELTFLRKVEAFKVAIPSLTEEQRVAGAMRLVAAIGDGHTQLEPRSARFALWYPIRLYQFTDGFFVTGAHRSASDLAGAEILEIAGRPAAEVAAAARGLMGADNATAALGVARLNTEINPGEWRTWYNLGNLQMSAGQRADALASYRRCLALDDPTNFNAERLRAIVAEAE